MKNTFLATLSFVAVLTVAKAEEPINSVNYDHGFCVPIGVDLKEDQAVLVVRGQYFLYSRELGAARGHNFFDFTNGVKALSGFDWGGRFELTKLAVPIFGMENLAVYRDTTHLGSLPTPILVRCSPLLK